MLWIIGKIGPRQALVMGADDTLEVLHSELNEHG